MGVRELQFPKVGGGAKKNAPAMRVERFKTKPFIRILLNAVCAGTG